MTDMNTAVIGEAVRTPAGKGKPGAALSSAADERARDAHRRAAPGDRY